MYSLYWLFCVGPLALYLLFLGWANTRRKPFVLSGAIDTGLLGLALCGFVVIGPMRMFLPDLAAAQYGFYTWLMILSLYGLCLTSILLMSRPRIVIYNTSSEQVQQTLRELSQTLDPETRWAGTNLSMPTLGISLHLENSPTTANIQLVSSGETQDYSNWMNLEAELRRALEGSHSSKRFGLLQLLAGAFLLVACCYQLITIEEAEFVSAAKELFFIRD
ncbi:MAG: hypothetical protein MPJ24_04235 [Pirellulaceae bacterium]|nr:hypothetical protein [Pirellulaceae bacterium]